MKLPPYRRSYDREKVSFKGVDFTIFRRLLGYLSDYRILIGLSVVLLVLAKTVEAVVPILIGKLAQEILGPVQLMSEKVFPMELVHWGIGLAALLALGYVFDAVNVLVKNWVGQRALLSLRSEIYDAIQRMPISFFDGQSVGRLMSRTIHDVEQINQLYSESIVPIMGNVLLLAGIMGAVTYLSWQVSLITLTVVPLLWWLTHQFRRNQRRCFELLRAIVSALNGFVQERLMGVSTIWVFGSHKRERVEFEEINSDYCTANLESIENLAVFIAGIEFLHNLVLVMIFATLMALAINPGIFDAGLFFTFSLYALMVFRPISDLAERYNVLQSAVAAGERIFDILDREREPYGVGEELGDIHTISFEDVWFAYQADNWILHGLSFTVQKGESLAIVGTTGAGKTTVIGLLLRLYDIKKGSIKINGRDIKDYSLQSLRRQFSVVPQDPILFSGTLAENIAMDSPSVTQEMIDRAATYVNLQPVVEKSPMRMQQIISGGGSGLSAGEGQLITLARAVAHNGSVYILDEATANIDTASERKIQTAMNKILEEKTAVVIAHRLSTIQHAHRIMVMSQGKVAEEGTHEQLLRQRGIYEKLYRLQFK